MRAALDEGGNSYAVVVLATAVEKELGVTISDAELDRVKTLRDFARVVQDHFPPGIDCEARSIELVERVARESSIGLAVEGVLDIPLMDSIHPSRWST
jgi:Phosphopantetheine attachment site